MIVVVMIIVVMIVVVMIDVVMIVVVYCHCRLQRVSQNLHVALCFTPLSEQLACVCRMFPALVTQVTVNVYDDWAPMALHGVALKYFQDMEFGQGGYGAWLLKVIPLCQY